MPTKTPRLPFPTAQAYILSHAEECRRVRPYGDRALHVSFIVGQTSFHDGLDVFMWALGGRGTHSLVLTTDKDGNTVLCRHEHHGLDSASGGDLEVRDLAELGEHIAWMEGMA